jgi:hypothetical protein
VKLPAGRPLDGAPARDRTREIAVVHEAGTQDPARLVVAQGEVLEHAPWDSGAVHGGLEALARQDGLRGVLQEHRVAGHQRGHDGVHGCEVGVVPGRDDEHDPQRLALDDAAEARPLVVGRHVGEARVGDPHHVARALLDAAELASEAHRPAHHLGKLRHRLLVHGEQFVEGT